MAFRYSGWLKVQITLCPWTYKRQIDIPPSPSNQTDIHVFDSKRYRTSKFSLSFNMLGNNWPDYVLQQFYIISPFDGPRTPKRTPMACQFCRGKWPVFVCKFMARCIDSFYLGRKLKCDGMKPSCANCDRRGYPCTYAPVSGWVDNVNA
jgi:hypothetical protein